MSESKPRPPPPVGSEIKFRVCVECGGSIGAGGLCSFSCDRDTDDDLSRPTRFYVYKFDRVEEQEKAK